MHDEDQFDFTDDAKDETGQDETGEAGKAGWALLWLLGIPLPVLLVAYLIARGC